MHVVASTKTMLKHSSKETLDSSQRACHRRHLPSVSSCIYSEARTISSTMEEVLDFTRIQLTRKGYKRVLYKSEDAEKIKLLENKLNQAFKRFDVSVYLIIYPAY